ncbi:MAG UNVERIFIED_CONTAM: hypothetical protein LVR18_22080 [Planctomycetaceae bacterium]
MQRTDAVNKDVRLTSTTGSIYVDYIDAGQLSGAVRKASRVILRAAGTIQEPADRIDNAMPEDPELQNGYNIIDVVAWKVIFYHDMPMADALLIRSEEDTGSIEELEIMYTSEAGGVTEDDVPNDSLPSNVTGNYVLDNADYYDDIDMTITGNLVINLAPSGGGQSMKFNVSGSITINTTLDVGGGVITLQTPGAVTVTAPIVASEVVVSAGSVTQPLVTDADRVTVSVTQPGQTVVIQEADSVILADTSVAGGTLTMSAGGSITVDGTVGNVNSLNLTSSGAIRSMVGSSLTVNGLAHLSGSSITIGDQPGDSINFGGLQVTSTGAVTITEDSDISLQGSSTAGRLTLFTAGTITDSGAGVSVTGNATLQGSTINLANASGESLVVGGNAQFRADNGGEIRVSSAGNAQFGSLTFQTTGTVNISEDGDTALSGSSHAQTINLDSSGAMTDNVGSVLVLGNAVLSAGSFSLSDGVGESIEVQGNVRLTSTSGNITVASAGTTNFGTLTFGTTGNVTIHEDSATELTGSSSGGSLSLVSSGSITDLTGGAAQVSVNGQASFTGTSIVLGDQAGDSLTTTGNASFTTTGGGEIDLQAAGTFNFLTVTFNSAGNVDITEDSDTEIVGANTASTLLMTSSGAIIDPAQIVVQQTATFIGTSIYLAGDAADVLNVADNVLLIASGGGSITVAAAGLVTMGSVTFQTTGTVLIVEDDGTLLTGTSTAGQLTLQSAGQISNTASASVTTTANASLTAPSMNLGTAAGDALNFASLTLSSTGSVTLIEDSSTSLTNTSTVDTLTLTSATGGISIDGTLNVGTDGTLRALGATPDIQVNGNASTTSGVLRLRANRDVLFAAASQMLSTNGSLIVEADAAGAGTAASGAITMTNGARINAGSGTVTMTAPGDISISMISTTGTAAVTSTQGGIVDAGDTDIDLQGGGFALSAVTGIGSANPLETSITTLAYQHTGSGEVRIQESDSLTVNSVGSLSSSSSAGTVRLTTTNWLAFSGVASQATLFATTATTAATNEDIRINSGATVRVTSGNATLTAGDHIQLVSGSLLLADLAELILIAGFGDSDNVGGMTLDGTIQALAAGQTVTLDLNDQQGATQNASAGGILAPNLRLISDTATSASFSLLAAGQNDVDVLAANTSGSVVYTDLDDLTIGSIAASSGIAAMNGISTVNSVSEGAAVSVIVSGTLTADQPIRTSPTAGPGSLNSGTVMLESLNAIVSLTDNGDIFADGPVTLTAAAGIQTAGEVTTSNDNVTYVSAVTLTGGCLHRYRIRCW